MSAQNNKINFEVTDDDLDSFLDGVLDNFDNQSIPTIQPVKPKIENKEELKEEKKDDKPAAAADPFDLDLEGIDDEMAKQLTQGMLQLLQGMDPKDAADFESNIEKIAGDLEKNLNVSDKEAKSTNKGKKTTTSFQDTISETINNLKSSSDKVEAEVSETNNDVMEKLLKQMEGLVDEDFCDVLSGVIDQLMSKELLYDSMKDLSDRYPSWLEENKDKLSKKEIENYENQYDCCKKIVDIFEKYEGNEISKEDNKNVSELMQKMQGYGNPPSEILKELAPDMIVGPDNIPKLPDNIPEGDCAQM
ncbi:Pex19-domain-containing protein [Piromyces finnis]|uniref:Pex19-domain-containing protein n=1 Tax=Piromyces finnis TaxID=1754191 RepID=A0A1Y1VH95_9FUNG|nr:Pex19-domain-containing protein [Piromyces finnis]|eukprot:ORX56030.1 Pex19-domain-containing protein [Piromyces finnis]